MVLSQCDADVIKVQLQVLQCVVLLNLPRGLHHFSKVHERPLRLSQEFKGFHQCGQRIAKHGAQEAGFFERGSQSGNADISLSGMNLAQSFGNCSGNFCSR